MSFRSARESAGISKSDLARQLGLSVDTPGKWELGISLPRAATLAKLAALYCCTIEELLEPDVREPPSPKDDNDEGEGVRL